MIGYRDFNIDLTFYIQILHGKASYGSGMTFTIMPTPSCESKQ
jgi:hypothetical protein